MRGQATGHIPGVTTIDGYILMDCAFLCRQDTKHGPAVTSFPTTLWCKLLTALLVYIHAIYVSVILLTCDCWKVIVVYKVELVLLFT